MDCWLLPLLRTAPDWLLPDSGSLSLSPSLSCPGCAPLSLSLQISCCMWPLKRTAKLSPAGPRNKRAFSSRLWLLRRATGSCTCPVRPLSLIFTAVWSSPCVVSVVASSRHHHGEMCGVLLVRHAPHSPQRVCGCVKSLSQPLSAVVCLTGAEKGGPEMRRDLLEGPSARRWQSQDFNPSHVTPERLP